MDIRLGWSGEIDGSWKKMDISVDESDLADLFAEHEIVEPKITPLEKFKLLKNLGEGFVLLHQMSVAPRYFATDENKTTLRALFDQRGLLIEEIKKRESDKAPF